MFCRHCGNQLDDDAKFCSSCGNDPRRAVSQIPKKKGKVGKVILIVVGVLFALGVIGNMVSDDTEQKPASASVPAAAKSPSSSSSSASSSIREEDALRSIGDTITISGVSFKLENAYESEGNSLFTPSDGNTYLVCSFDIANNSKKDFVLSTLLCFEAYVDDYSVNQTFFSGNSDKTLDGTVAVGKKISGSIAYEVPSDWAVFELSVTPDIISGKKANFKIAKTSLK